MSDNPQVEQATPESNKDRLSDLFTKAYDLTNGNPRGFDHDGRSYGVQGARYSYSSEFQTIAVSVEGSHTFILHEPSTNLVAAQDQKGKLSDVQISDLLRLVVENLS
jgi:hypothetical protein